MANNLANFELANQILVGEPNFDLANTIEFFANPNKIWRTEMRLGELHFELPEQQNFYQWDQMVNFSNFRQKNIFTVLGVANKNVTSLSSTHCSAPSAWPFRGNIIGFSRFWRKLVIFCTRNIYQI